MGAETKKIKISVLTKSEFLFQKIRMELHDVGECIFCADGVASRDSDTVLRCTEDFDTATAGEITLGRDGADIALPFRIGALKDLFSKEGKTLCVIPEEKCARLSGRTVRLTDVELALLSSLLKREGGYVSREELLHEVWGESADSGVINVYVHYLREKLEVDGERIILCSRNYGYKIDEKYVGRSER